MNDPADSPENLIRAALGGDVQALDRLLVQYRNYLKILGKVQIDARLQAKADPSDLVQETLTQAYAEFPRFRGTSEAEFVAWLRQIMAFRTAKLVRRYFGTARRDARLEEQLQHDLDASSQALGAAVASRGSSPSERAARRERAVLLADAIAQLPPDYQQVLILHHMEGRPMKDVAEHMNRTVDSVQKLWARALIKLRPLVKNL